MSFRVHRVGRVGLVLSVLFVLSITACKNKSKSPAAAKRLEVEKRVDIKYSLLFPKDSIKQFLENANQRVVGITALVNRADEKFLMRMDTIIVPSDAGKDIKQYFPFPFYVTSLEQVNKIILFSYATQSFAAYENGLLVRTGPSSMGKASSKTPTGLFFTNWKAEETISTVNDEWELKWNFNIENKEGVGFHQYEMPGYPASHSCLRLKENDAKYFFNWADQWKIEGTDNIVAYGTPVIVFGDYNFSAPKPWWSLVQNSTGMNMSESDIDKLVNTHLPEILQKQEQRKMNG